MDEAITRDPQTFAIPGAAFEIRRHLGSGYLEAIYRSAIRVEFGLREISYEAERTSPSPTRRVCSDDSVRTSFALAT